ADVDIQRAVGRQRSERRDATEHALWKCGRKSGMAVFLVANGTLPVQSRARARAGDAWRGIHDKLPGPGRRRARYRARAHVPARAKPVGKCAPTRRPKTFFTTPYFYNNLN